LRLAEGVTGLAISASSTSVAFVISARQGMVGATELATWIVK
jgi:hypothetical protein